MAAIKISSPGILNGFAVGFPGLDVGDAIVTVNASSSDADLTVPSAAPSVATITINGRQYTAGRAIVFDVSAAAGMKEDLYFLYFDYTTAGGERLRYEKQVRVVDYIELD